MTDSKADLVALIESLDGQACNGNFTQVQRDQAEIDLFALWHGHDVDEREWTPTAYMRLGSCLRRNDPLLAYEVFAAGLGKFPASLPLRYQQGLTLVQGALADAHSTSRRSWLQKSRTPSCSLMFISCYEAEDELIPSPADQLHHGTGTSFLLIVMVLAIFVFAPIGLPAWYWLVLSRILGIPLIAGLSYEVIKWAGKNRRKAWVRAVMWPGLMLQNLTTREPDEEQLAVAIASLNAVLARETPRRGEAPIEIVAGDGRSGSSADGEWYPRVTRLTFSLPSPVAGRLTSPRLRDDRAAGRADRGPASRGWRRRCPIPR